MTQQCSLLAFTVLLLSSASLAQHEHDKCPEGFRYAGTIKGTGSFVEVLDKRLEIKLPVDATLDTSYQQTKVVADNGQGKHSNVRPQDIPKGIHIVPYGQDDNGKAWAVSDSTLRTVSEADGKTRKVFGMHFYCTVPEFARQFGGCAVNVDVCYKPMK